MRNMFLAVILLVCTTSPLLAEDTIPAAEWKAFLKIHDQRDALDKHKEAAVLLDKLAEKYARDRHVQLFCAKVAYHLAHRLDDDSELQKTTALAGVKCTDRALALNRKDYDARYWKIRDSFKARVSEGVSAGLKEAKNARKMLEKLIKLNPKRMEGYFLLGGLYVNLPSLISWGDNEKGLYLLEKAIAIDPTDAELLLELANAYDKMGREEDAKKAYQKCIDKGTGHKNLDWEVEDAKQYAKKKLKELE